MTRSVTAPMLDAILKTGKPAIARALAMLESAPFSSAALDKFHVASKAELRLILAEWDFDNWVE